MAKNIYRYTNLKDESLKLRSIQEYEEAEKKVSQLDKEIGEIPVKERIPFYHLRTQEFSKLIGVIPAPARPLERSATSRRSPADQTSANMSPPSRSMLRAKSVWAPPRMKTSADISVSSLNHRERHFAHFAAHHLVGHIARQAFKMEQAFRQFEHSQILFA